MITKRLFSLTLTLILVIVISCNYEYTNPYDRDCPPEIWSPQNLTAESTDDGVFITWEQQEEHIDGFMIKRSNDSIEWITLTDSLLDYSQREYFDSIHLPGQSIYYQIYAIADLNASNNTILFLNIPAELPTIITNEATEIGTTHATLNGEIISDGGSEIIEKGFCYATTPMPDTNDVKVISTSEEDSFAEQVTELSSDTKYYIRAYAINAVGINYGDELIFTTECDCKNKFGTFTDSRDGHVYKTIQIGTQTWMAENLKYLPSVVGSGTSSHSYTIPYYYVYGYDGTNVTAAKATNNYTTYGVLYNWYVAMNACPSGWHLPNDDEWKQLEMYIGMSQNEADDFDIRGTDEGTKLKATSGWYNNGNGTNKYCFGALPGGYYCAIGLGSFNSVGESGIWWSATVKGGTPLVRQLDVYHSGVYRYDLGGSDGVSVRCVRD